HKRLEVSSDDLASILELDDTTDDLTHASLWEAATGMAVQARVTPELPAEAVIVDAIETYIDSVRSSDSLPEYWLYHLTTLATDLRVLIMATPAEWQKIRSFASAWSSSIDEKWSTLRPSAKASLSHIRAHEERVLKLINSVPDGVNSRAVGLAAFLCEIP